MRFEFIKYQHVKIGFGLILHQQNQILRQYTVTRTTFLNVFSDSKNIVELNF